MVSFGEVPAGVASGGSTEERALLREFPPVGIEVNVVATPRPAVSRDTYPNVHINAGKYTKVVDVQFPKINIRKGKRALCTVGSVYTNKTKQVVTYQRGTHMTRTAASFCVRQPTDLRSCTERKATVHTS